MFYITMLMPIQYTISSAKVDSNKWHGTLGRIGKTMTCLARIRLIYLLAKVNLPNCKHCLGNIATIKPFSKANFVLLFLILSTQTYIDQ